MLQATLLRTNMAMIRMAAKGEEGWLFRDEPEMITARLKLPTSQTKTCQMQSCPLDEQPARDIMTRQALCLKSHQICYSSLQSTAKAF